MTRPRHPAAILLALAVLLSACASAPAPSGPVPNIAGNYVGEYDPVNETFDSTSLPMSTAHVQLSQNGRDVSGTFNALGLSGNITGQLSGNQLSGSADIQTDVNEFNVTFDARVEGDTLRATLDSNSLTLRRVEPTEAVAMQNPRTKQVILCRGSARAIAGCSTGLAGDGWKALNR